MRHGLFSVDILAGAHRIDDYLPVPVVGNCRDDAVDVLVVEKILVAAGDGKMRAPDSARQDVSPIVEIGRARALNSREPDGRPQQTGSLHAYANHPEAHPVAWGSRSRSRLKMLGRQENGLTRQSPTCCGCTDPEKFTA